MGKKKNSAKPNSSDLREIKRLDLQICELLNQRASLWNEIYGDTENPSDLWDAYQKYASSTNVVKKSKGPIGTGSLELIFDELQKASHAIVSKVRVAMLGPINSFSHLATMQHFGRGADLVPVTAIRAVFEEVATGNCDFGVVPVENSTDGRITDTFKMFARQPEVRICGEIPLAIHHCLLTRDPKTKINRICSKPQALSQCRDWLANHYNDIEQVPMSSTTAAAEAAAKDATIAAIASEQAGLSLKLHVRAKNIEDNKNNVTRFVLIGKESAKRTGRDKTALMYALPHEAGALADVMMIFKRTKLNMTLIESFPMPDSPTEYLFFVEFEGHQNDTKVKRALASLGKRTAQLFVLGSYPSCTN